MKKARQVPKVSVYSRHRSDCKWAGDESRVGCDCPKWLRWFRNGQLYRQTADTCDGEVAERKARQLANSFERAANGEVAPEKPKGKLLEEAVDDFLASKEAKGITAKHVAKLKYELGEFSRFALSRGLAMVGDVATEHILAWRNSLEGAQNTRAKKVFRLIGFFEFCVEMGWIVRNVARAQSIVIPYSDEQEPKALTDAQFEQLLSAIPKVNGRTTDGQRRKLHSLRMSSALGYDIYAFPPSNRGIEGETETWFGRHMCKGKPFNIYLPGSIGLSSSGNIDGNPTCNCKN